MAQKKSTLVADPPSASSESEGEQYSTEEEEVESSTEEEEETTQTKNEGVTKPMARSSLQFPSPLPKNSETGEDSESETDGDSDSDEPVVPPVNITKPSPSKPTKTNTNPSSGKSPVPSKGKRTAEADLKGKETKRSKEKEPESDVGEKSEDVKKNLFQRLWSEEDEVALLEGACTFAEKTGINVVKDMAAFYEFIKSDMHFDVSLNQLRDKFWRLKKRFENGLKTGDKKTFTNDHNRKIFNLSKKLWSGAVEEPPKPNGKAKTSKFSGGDSSQARIISEETKNMDELEMGIDRFTGIEEYVLKKGMELLDGSKKTKMVDRLRQLHVDELELFLKRNELVRDCTKLLLASHSHRKNNDRDADH